MEKIHEPVLLISTEADTVWPSAERADLSEQAVDFIQNHWE